MSLSGAREYRLLHKKDGTYVLQVKMEDFESIDEDSRIYTCVEYWEDLETVEEEDEKAVD